MFFGHWFFSLFISVVLFQNQFSFVGVYIISDILIFSVAASYFIYKIIGIVYTDQTSQSENYLTRVLKVLLLIFCSYPLFIWSLSAYSVYPMLKHLLINPSKIGEKRSFHLKLYEYCSHSKSKQEFDLKIIVINYVCIRAYFHRLNESDEYYQFAEMFQRIAPSQLGKLSLWQFNSIFMNNAYHKLFRNMPNFQVADATARTLLAYHQLALLDIKIFQLIFRTTMLIFCLLL
eukprot:372871_1